MRGMMPTIPISVNEIKKQTNELIELYEKKAIINKQKVKEKYGMDYTWSSEREFPNMQKELEEQYKNAKAKKINDVINIKYGKINENNELETENETDMRNMQDYAESYRNDKKEFYKKSRGIKINLPEIDANVIMKNSGININDLITALGITRYQVNNMRTKPRYMEQIKMRFGISPTDERMQLPEYIGINRINIQTNAVTQTAPTTQGSQEGVGNITGQAFGVAQNETINYRALEWGIIISLMIIKPKPVYELGAPKMWIKKTKFDFATPELANILDVPIYNAELNYSEKNRTRKKIFGWTSVYDDYRTINNIVANDLRPSVPQSMSTYTLAMKVPENVQLNSDFISCTPDMARIKQYTNQDDFVFYTQANITTAIPLPLTSDPNKAVI